MAISVDSYPHLMHVMLANTQPQRLSDFVGFVTSIPPRGRPHILKFTDNAGQRIDHGRDARSRGAEAEV